jgi:hypothetical protein
MIEIHDVRFPRCCGKRAPNILQDLGHHFCRERIIEVIYGTFLRDLVFAGIHANELNCIASAWPEVAPQVVLCNAKQFGRKFYADDLFERQFRSEENHLAFAASEIDKDEFAVVHVNVPQHAKKAGTRRRPIINGVLEPGVGFEFGKVEEAGGVHREPPIESLVQIAVPRARQMVRQPSVSYRAFDNRGRPFDRS